MSYQQQTLFDHLKLHDKYLFDAKTCQIVAAVDDPKWGVLLVIVCCCSSFNVDIKIFRRVGGNNSIPSVISILPPSALIARRLRDSVCQRLREWAR